MNDDVFRPGELCGTYRIVRLLGRGGFADVYQAIDVTNQQKVALKCLQLRHLTNARITQRMVAETELLAGLDHPNVVQVEDAGINGGVLWLAMEYLSGKTLRERLRAARGPLAPEVALYYARQIGEGVAAAHELNVVHRDLKPENIMITAKDEVKVLDLGAAKFFDRELTLTGTEGAIGTPLYMSPEQIKAEAVDVRADVYALGMILYEMLAGRHAFAQPNGELPPAFEIGTLQLHAKPAPLTGVGKGSPVAVWQLVEKAIAKDPADRFASMAQFARAIRAALRNVLESPGADQLWDDVMADPGPAPAARRSEEEEVDERAVFESQEAALKAKPSEEPAAPTVALTAAPTAAPTAEPGAQPDLRAAPEEVSRKKSSRPFVPNGGEENDPDDEPHSGVRNIAALSPAAAPEAPPPKPALARVVRIGPGGRQGEIVPAPAPVEALASGSEASIAVDAAVPVVDAAVPVVDAAVPVAEAIVAVAPPLEEAPAVVPPSMLASTGAPGSEEPVVVSEQGPPAGLEVAGAPGKLEEVAAPPAAVVSLWSRLRAALRSRSGVAIALAPLLVLLGLVLRPAAAVPLAHSSLPGFAPVLIAAASQPVVEAPPRAEPNVVTAINDATPLPAADKPADAPPKAKPASRPRALTQAAPAGRGTAATPASAEECGKLLVLVSTPRCPTGKMASAAAPPGHGKL